MDKNLREKAMRRNQKYSVVGAGVCGPSTQVLEVVLDWGEGTRKSPGKDCRRRAEEAEAGRKSGAFSNGAHLLGDYFKMLVLQRALVLQKKQEKKDLLRKTFGKRTLNLMEELFKLWV